ncbi:hypothetical protein M6D81_03230 [Paenibacillus sp. J5C_2022]|uniref:hypothetical protein n=1 Tax=Paenibacillus sp. J5C2022 TaxID=2977129 RepID=UPI0021D05B85|nr:hypothetical protein [Paenibacillus sp. J5C2022]MCU6707712.1 hypothetical protein [Paenibacillus sp. J5C2022]
MNLTLIWFLLNILFVTSAIVFLFQHRNYAQAKQQHSDAARLGSLARRRTVSAVIAIAMFIAMSASFILNMKING